MREFFSQINPAVSHVIYSNFMSLYHRFYKIIPVSRSEIEKVTGNYAEAK